MKSQRTPTRLKDQKVTKPRRTWALGLSRLLPKTEIPPPTQPLLSAASQSATTLDQPAAVVDEISLHSRRPSNSNSPIQQLAQPTYFDRQSFVFVNKPDPDHSSPAELLSLWDAPIRIAPPPQECSCIFSETQQQNCTCNQNIILQSYTNQDIESDDDNDNGNNNIKAKKKDKAKAKGKPKAIWACPFYRYDATHHTSCMTLGLTRIRDVKQHIHRRHSNKDVFSCPECFRSFSESKALVHHIRTTDCSTTDITAHSSSVRVDIQQRVRHRSSRKLTAEEQWFALFEILFPASLLPNSPYLNTPIEEALEILQNRINCHGTSLISNFLESRAQVWQNNPENVELLGDFTNHLMQQLQHEPSQDTPTLSKVQVEVSNLQLSPSDIQTGSVSVSNMCQIPFPTSFNTQPQPQPTIDIGGINCLLSNLDSESAENIRLGHLDNDMLFADLTRMCAHYEDPLNQGLFDSSLMY